MLWTLAESGDTKSAEFVRKELLEGEKDLRRIAFLNAVADVRAYFQA